MSVRRSEQQRRRTTMAVAFIVIGLVLLIARRTDLGSWALLFPGAE